MRKWIPLGVLIGAAGGLGAMLLQFLLTVMREISYGAVPIPWYLVVVVPAAGAFAAGLIMQRFTPRTAGQGMSCVIDALNFRDGRLMPLSAPVKLVVTALTVGTGGSGGREGPVAQICGAIATFLGDKLQLRREDLKILVISSIAAGTSAVFRAPIGGAIFALELPYKNDLEGRAVFPATFASVVSYIVFVPFNGTYPVFTVPLETTAFTVHDIPFFLLIGLLAGLSGIGFVLLYRAVRAWFRAAALPLYVKTGLGGLLVGVIGLAFPQVLGLGITVVQAQLSGAFALGFLLLLLPMKILATSITVGSYGSGGVFTTSLICGACLGGLVAGVFGLSPQPLFMIVGMGAFAAGVTKTPVGCSIIVAEMAGGFSIFIPVVIASVIGYITTGNFAMYENMSTRGWYPKSSGELEEIKVKDLMARHVVSLSAGAPVRSAYLMGEMEPQQFYPVTDRGRVVGTMEHETLDANLDSDAPLSTVMDDRFVIVSPEDTVRSAYEAMMERGAPRAVVESGPGNVAGILGLEEVLGIIGNICTPLEVVRKERPPEPPTIG